MDRGVKIVSDWWRRILIERAASVGLYCSQFDQHLVCMYRQ